jgi:ribosomal protein S18 acetylase RimI-like enzyme
MPEIEIRPARSEDIQQIIDLEHNYFSEFVWQMDIRRMDGEINISFREIRLPRIIQVSYPKQYKDLKDEWTDRDGILVSDFQDLVVGYVSLNRIESIRTSWITDIAVMNRYRRQGIGTALIIAAQEWAMQKFCRRLILEMQPKNYPGIQLAKKMGFDLCGYNDHYYANNDIAIFFSKWLG